MWKVVNYANYVLPVNYFYDLCTDVINFSFSALVSLFLFAVLEICGKKECLLCSLPCTLPTGKVFRGLVVLAFILTCL